MNAMLRTQTSYPTPGGNAAVRPTSTHGYYQQLLSRRSQGGCPALFLAPMENLMDRSTRVSLLDSLTQHKLGTCDEACTEFIRVPAKSEHPSATVRGITADYAADELGAVPLAAQLMGSSTELLAAAAIHLVENKGAPRIDLNCGCPANVVTGGGAGSSLLRDPTQLQQVVAAIVSAVGHQVPVSVKMRSGFLDTSLFKDNLLAVQEAGAAFVTLHPRTKQQAYNGRADWSLIALAKELLHIPVVGNGDVICVSSALSLLQETGCDGIMVGRGALQDPLIFHRIYTHFNGSKSSSSSWPQQQQMQCHQQHEDDALHQVQYTQQAAAVQARQAGPVQQLQQQSQECAHEVDEAAVVADFLQRYAACGWRSNIGGAREVSQSGRIGRLKKVMKYLFSGQSELRASCEHLLRVQPDKVSPEQLLGNMLQQIELNWQPGGPSERFLVSHMSMPGRANTTWQQAAAGATATEVATGPATAAAAPAAVGQTKAADLARAG